jgi:hypothetical protein
MGELAIRSESGRRGSLPAKVSDRDTTFCSDDRCSSSTKSEMEWAAA